MAKSSISMGQFHPFLAKNSQTFSIPKNWKTHQHQHQSQPPIKKKNKNIPMIDYLMGCSDN
jgi:hypothetical protein